MNLRSLVPLGGQAASPARLDAFLFGPIDRLLEQISQTGANGVTNAVPKIDVAETDKTIEISAELPGLEEGDVEISLVDNVLTIRGEKRAEQERDEQNFHVTERIYGAFYRAIELPAGVDPSRVEASMSNGVLRISIPKPARSETQKISVQKGDRAKAEKQDKTAA
jgi:HSP20 family protein